MKIKKKYSLFFYFRSEAKKRRKDTSESTEDDTAVESKGKSNKNMFNFGKLICKCPLAKDKQTEYQQKKKRRKKSPFLN